MTTTATKKAIKTVQIIARVQFKHDARKVVYLVRGSKGEQYETYMFAGEATSCTCAARKPCYHMRQLEDKEFDRQLPELGEIDLRPNADGDYLNLLTYCLALEEQASQPADTTDLIIDAEYEQWKRENMLDNTMSRDEYVGEFDPCAMEVR